jgi:hypothetical protein
LLSTKAIDKIFDPSNLQNNPQNCGYAARLFKINTNEEQLEIINLKNKRVETKINLNDVKGILLPNSSKAIIKNKKIINLKPNQDVTKLIHNNEYIPLNLLIANGNLELIASNYQIFKIFEEAIDEITKKKKNLYGLLKHVENC